MSTTGWVLLIVIGAPVLVMGAAFYASAVAAVERRVGMPASWWRWPMRVAIVVLLPVAVVVALIAWGGVEKWMEPQHVALAFVIGTFVGFRLGRGRA